MYLINENDKNMIVITKVLEIFIVKIINWRNNDVKSLFNCNNVRVELINKLILKKKEIHEGQNNLRKWIKHCQVMSSHDDLYFCFVHIWTLNVLLTNRQ